MLSDRDSGPRFVKWSLIIFFFVDAGMNLGFTFYTNADAKLGSKVAIISLNTKAELISLSRFKKPNKCPRPTECCIIFGSEHSLYCFDSSCKKVEQVPIACTHT